MNRIIQCINLYLACICLEMKLHFMFLAGSHGTIHDPTKLVLAPTALFIT